MNVDLPTPVRPITAMTASSGLLQFVSMVDGDGLLVDLPNVWQWGLQGLSGGAWGLQAIRKRGGIGRRPRRSLAHCIGVWIVDRYGGGRLAYRRVLREPRFLDICAVALGILRGYPRRLSGSYIRSQGCCPAVFFRRSNSSQLGIAAVSPTRTHANTSTLVRLILLQTEADHDSHVMEGIRHCWKVPIHYLHVGWVQQSTVGASLDQRDTPGYRWAFCWQVSFLPNRLAVFDTTRTRGVSHISVAPAAALSWALIWGWGVDALKV